LQPNAGVPRSCTNVRHARRRPWVATEAEINRQPRRGKAPPERPLATGRTPISGRSAIRFVAAILAHCPHPPRAVNHSDITPRSIIMRNPTDNPKRSLTGVVHPRRRGATAEIYGTCADPRSRRPRAPGSYRARRGSPRLIAGSFRPPTVRFVFRGSGARTMSTGGGAATLVPAPDPVKKFPGMTHERYHTSCSSPRNSHRKGPRQRGKTGRSDGNGRPAAGTARVKTGLAGDAVQRPPDCLPRSREVEVERARPIPGRRPAGQDVQLGWECRSRNLTAVPCAASQEPLATPRLARARKIRDASRRTPATRAPWVRGPVANGKHQRAPAGANPRPAGQLGSNMKNGKVGLSFVGACFDGADRGPSLTARDPPIRSTTTSTGEDETA